MCEGNKVALLLIIPFIGLLLIGAIFVFISVKETDATEVRVEECIESGWDVYLNEQLVDASTVMLERYDITLDESSKSVILKQKSRRAHIPIFTLLH